MNYVKETKAFYDRLETNPLSAAAIALWHTLMHMKDKVGWVESFTVALPVLCYKSGLEEREMVKARQELMDKGYVRVRFPSDQQLPLYTVVSLAKQNQDFVPPPETERETRAKLESETELDHKLSNCQLQASIKKIEFLNKMRKKEEQSFVRIVLNDVELHHDHLIDWNKLRPGEYVTVSLDIGQTCHEQNDNTDVNQNSKSGVRQNGKSSAIHNDKGNTHSKSKGNAHNKGKGNVEKKSNQQPIEEWITVIEGDPELKEGERVIEEFIF